MKDLYGRFIGEIKEPKSKWVWTVGIIVVLLATNVMALSAYRQSTKTVQLQDGVIMSTAMDVGRISLENASLKNIPERVVTKTVVKVKIKKVYIQGPATQTEVEPGRIKVEFNKKQDRIKIDGWTLTNPAEFGLNIYQEPIKIELVSTYKDGKYQVYAATNDPSVIIDELVFAAQAPKPWYNRIHVDTSVGPHTLSVALGFYSDRFGAGVGYNIIGDSAFVLLNYFPLGVK